MLCPRSSYCHAPGALGHALSTLPSSTYGADASGLICGFRFGSSGQGVALSATEALLWLQPEGLTQQLGFVWLHFNLAHSAAEKWMREHVTLSDQFYESLRDGSRSTRVELDDDMLVAVVNDVHYDFAFEPSDISTLWLSVGPHLVVSARLQPLRSIDRLRDAVKRGAPMHSSVSERNEKVPLTTATIYLAMVG